MSHNSHWQNSPLESSIFVIWLMIQPSFLLCFWLRFHIASGVEIEHTSCAIWRWKGATRRSEGCYTVLKLQRKTLWKSQKTRWLKTRIEALCLMHLAWLLDEMHRNHLLPLHCKHFIWGFICNGLVGNIIWGIFLFFFTFLYTLITRDSSFLWFLFVSFYIMTYIILTFLLVLTYDLL